MLPPDPLPPDAPPQADPPSDLEQFAVEVAKELIAIRQSMPAAAEPALAPIVNVTTPEVVVNVAPAELPAQSIAPVFNVPAAEVIVNVAPAGPAISLNAQNVGLAFEITPMVDAIATVSTAIAANDVTTVLQSLVTHTQGQVSAMQDQARATAALAANMALQVEATSAMAASVAQLAKAMLAPRSIVTDSAGQPVGISIDRKRIQ